MLKHSDNININLSNLANDLNIAKALSELSLKFYQTFGLKAIIGAELEFYLSNSEHVAMLEKELCYKFIKERGNNQWEVNFPPYQDITALADLIRDFKLQLQTTVEVIGGRAIFDAKPFQDDYGSALHIHINFLDKNGQNFCVKEENTNLIASSLCFYIRETFMIFAPNSDSYNRFNGKFMAPTNISFGPNNRSTALRIPDSHPKRIEHRLAGSDADPYLVLYTILNSIYLGMSNPSKIPLVKKIYGNAFDNHYNLIKFPHTIEEAKRLFNAKFFIL
jgi:glutamine synthetase